MSGRARFLFVAGEDWFVVSHFMPMVRRAVADGYDVSVAARMGEAAAALNAAGAKTIDLSVTRGDNRARALFRAWSRVRGVLARERPDIVHAIGLKPIFLTLLGAGAAPQAKFFLALTGLGFLAATRAPRAVVMRALLSRMMFGAVRAGRARLLVENEDDRAWLERHGELPPERVVVLPGAGVEPERYAPSPEPEAPLRIGIVARLVRSKGCDVAISALALLRRRIPDAELWIAGAPDPENPARHTESELAAWAAQPGVKLIGTTSDVPAFWGQVHVACLPSRGGEGLPRSLIEASSCGRALVTTNVPGCRDFVVYGQTGFICPADDPEALAAAFEKLNDPALRRRMGAAGRKRVIERYTAAHVADLVSSAWRGARP